MMTVAATRHIRVTHIVAMFGDDSPDSVYGRPSPGLPRGWCGRQELAGVWVTAEYMDIIIVKVST